MPKAVDLDEIRELLPFATEAQRIHLQAILDHGTRNKAAAAMGVNASTVTRSIHSCKAKRDARAKHDRLEHLESVPDGYQIKGTSTLFGRDGGVVAQWVKTNQDAERMRRLWEQAVEAMAEAIPPAKPVKPPKGGDADKLNCFIITDYHIGMAAWHEEAGENWDTEIAEDLLYRWFEHAEAAAPSAHTAVLAQLGDFLHWDGLEAVTPANKHILDADTRFPLLVRVAIRALRRVIELLLRTHQEVVVICAEGNHDPASSIWLRELLSALYADEPRVRVDTTPNPYYCVEWGDTSLFFHHGHKRRPTNIDDVFVAKFREVFGRTKHSYGHMGHMHHRQVIESNLMVVEQHRTLAAADAYASRGGWASNRESAVITYSRKGGELGRVVLSPAMLEGVA